MRLEQGDTITVKPGTTAQYYRWENADNTREYTFTKPTDLYIEKIDGNKVYTAAYFSDRGTPSSKHKYILTKDQIVKSYRSSPKSITEELLFGK